MNTAIAVLLERKQSPVHSVASTVTVAEAVDVMNERKISSVLIIESGVLRGIFTERDVLRRVIGSRLDPHTTLLTDVMTHELATITPETTLDETISLFAGKHCRHLPVIREDKVIGLVSVGDISRWLSAMHQAEAEQLKDYISGGYSS